MSTITGMSTRFRVMQVLASLLLLFFASDLWAVTIAGNPVTVDPGRIGFDSNANTRDTVTITWRVADNVQTECNAMMLEKGGVTLTDQVSACSYWSEDDTCTIITTRITSMSILGHEVRHCYQGHWHPWAVTLTVTPVK